MAAEEKSTARGTIATVVATATLTLAIGVTAAALGGYLAPLRTGTTTNSAETSAPPAAEALPAARPGAPSVVLVPIAPDPPRDPVTAPVQPAPEVMLARYERTGDHDWDDDDDDHGHHDREHRGWEHEDDHEDD